LTDTICLDGLRTSMWVCRPMDLSSVWQRPGAQPITDIVEFGTLYMLRNHIHLDVKSEYILEKDPQKLWNSLRQQYEKKKTIVFSKGSYEWNQLHFQDFKSVDANNHIVSEINQNYRFFVKELSNADKLEKTLF